MTVLDIICPDHLKAIFDSSNYLEVDVDEKNTSRDACIVWLAQSINGVWITDNPRAMESIFKDKFAMYPYLKFENVTFCVPNRIPFEFFDKCVIDCLDDMPTDLRQLNVGEIRVLKNASTESVDKLGLSLEERKGILSEIRKGSSTNYDKFELIASITRESLFEFIKEFWGDVIAETPLWNWHIPYLANELQVLAEQVFRWRPKLYDLIINIPPGETKSTLATVMFPPWTWTRMPSSRFLGGSYVDTLAMDLSRKSKDIVECEKFKQSFPDVRLRKDQHAKSHFVNTKGGSRYSFGMNGTVTGMHAHFIGVDDPLNPEKAVSEVELAKANRVMSETLFTRKVDKDITPTVLIMQRLHQNDPTAHMLNTYGEVKHIYLPAEDSKMVKPAVLRAKYKDGLLDVVRLSRKTLDANFKALGEFSYAGQFGQRPVPRGGAMFKPNRIKIDNPPIAFKAMIRYWDKAGTDGAGCFTAGGKMAIDNWDRFWILHVERGQWAMEERESTILQTAQVDGPKVHVWVEQEPGSGGKDIAKYTIKKLKGFVVAADPVGASSGNKIVRAQPLASQVNGGNVFMAPGLWNKALLDELRYFPVSKYKDQVDCLSGAFNKLVKGEIEVGTI